MTHPGQTALFSALFAAFLDTIPSAQKVLKTKSPENKFRVAGHAFSMTLPPYSTGAGLAMHLIVAAFLIGIVAGLRSMTAPAVVSWAARLGHLALSGTWLAFFGYRWTPWIFTVAALGEFIGDKLPTTPSRKAPVPFSARIVMGALCGGALGVSTSNLYLGAACGVAGAVIGTLGGYAARSSATRALGGRDLPIALLEDILAVGLALCAVAFTA